MLGRCELRVHSRCASIEMVRKDKTYLIEIMIYYIMITSVFRGTSLSENENVESPEIRIRKWLTDYNIYDAEPSDFQKDDALEEQERERKDQNYKRKNKSSYIDVYIII